MTIINPNNPNASIREQQEMAEFARVLRTAPDMKCDKCESPNFITIFRIKKVSGLITGTGKDMVVPISVYACASCMNVNKFFLDKFENEGTEEK